MARSTLLLLLSLLALLAACSQHELPAASLSVVEVSPADGSQGVALDATVSVTFDAVLNEAALAGTIQLSANGHVVNGVLIVGEDGASLVFIPSGPLMAGATYNASLSESVQSLSGASLGKSLSWSFATANGTGDGDGSGGEDGGTGGGNGPVDNDGDGLTNDVDPDDNDPDVDGDGIQDGDDHDPLNPDADGDGVLDGSDDDLGIESLSGVSPRPGDVVSRFDPITLTFAVDLDPASLDGAAIDIYSLPIGNQLVNGSLDSATPVAGTLVYDAATRTLSFTPSEPLSKAPPFYWVFIDVDAKTMSGDDVRIEAHWRFRVF